MTEMDRPVLIGAAVTSPRIDAAVVGSKAAQLARMVELGLPVPPAFVMPTGLCAAICRGDADALDALRRGLDAGIGWLEQVTGRGFGDPRCPLLVSVRSGAAVSMPGMLDTVLDVGLNDQTVRGLIRTTGNPRLAFDSYRRLIQGYAEVVLGLAGSPFDKALAALMAREGVAAETALDPEALERLAADYRDLAGHLAGRPVPVDPRDQLFQAAVAVYRSWTSARAREYRRLNRLDDGAGTAVTVQAMVFGNAGGASGAGVAFSRNPATGENQAYVDFLFDAQGEDVVSGRRTPGDVARLAERLPGAARQLADGLRRLEAAQGDAQDVEFTIEDGRLHFLQTRSAKRTPRAALRMAVDMVREGLIEPAEALARVDGLPVDGIEVRRFATDAVAAATAVPASPGVAVGRAAFSTPRARQIGAGGDPVILVRPETSTDDVEGFALASGILTAAGGRTAHAAVVARQLGKVCLVGCRDLVVDEATNVAMLGDAPLGEGDWLSLDGDTGAVSIGRRAIVTAPPPELADLARWRAQMTGVREAGAV